MFWLAINRPTRPGFITDGPTPEESAIMSDHFEHRRALCEAGKLLMAGPCLDRSMGVSVLVAETEEEAWAMVRADPAVALGVMRAEVKAYRVSLWREGFTLG